ncbi:hypothetical protein E3N88_20131 [Mikania micrantha]|uniref:Uncharacterized protein n=1 Tax=Mikania micrantha TaxID=192012 RepID=A0A5N6NIY5_9ASTR|nr:hypothetical protein E3N88_20131 [Mikania micrantha]
MSRRKKLNIITTDSNLAVKDHVASETQGLHKSEMQGGVSSSQEFHSTNEQEATLDEVHQVAMANKKNKYQSQITEANEYEKIRQLRIQENKKRLQELGVKNIVQSLTSLTHSQTLKKKTLKQNCQAGDADYILDSGDDIQVGKSVVSKKQHPPKYIPPMSINRVANLRKLCRVFASNITQEVPSSSNATKQTLSETIEGNKRRAKRRMVLIDEADDEDDEIFEGDFHHDYENENMDANKRYDEEMIDHDDLQQQIQHPDNKKATGTPKKVRSHTQKAEIWKMVSNERILVMFNKFGKPVGDEGKELVQYLGTLVRMPEHVSIEHSDWRKVPMQQKEDMYSLVKSKFCFHQGETSQIKKWILYSMGKKWRTWKGNLKSRGYDPSLTIDEIVTQQTSNDDRVNPAQFKELVKRWFTPEFQHHALLGLQELRCQKTSAVAYV